MKEEIIYTEELDRLLNHLKSQKNELLEMIITSEKGFICRAVLNELKNEIGVFDEFLEFN